MDWSVQDLGALGEFVGSVAVLVTLIYLAYQFRQNSISSQNMSAGRKRIGRDDVDTCIQVSTVHPSHHIGVCLVGSATPGCSTHFTTHASNFSTDGTIKYQQVVVG